MELRLSSHCQERQVERGITDSEIEDAVACGATKFSRKTRKTSTGGGVTVVTQTDKATAVTIAITAYRSDETCHPKRADTIRRICEYGESSASEADSDEDEDDRAARKATVLTMARSWNERPSAKFWSCCNRKVRAAGGEDGCMVCQDVQTLKKADERKAAYSERSVVLKLNAKQRAASPDLEETDPSSLHRPWDDSIGDDAHPSCSCGYADGLYDWCECGYQRRCSEDDDTGSGSDGGGPSKKRRLE
jgi:hypothetical protein